MQQVLCGACHRVFEVTEDAPDRFACPHCGQKLQLAAQQADAVLPEFSEADAAVSVPIEGAAPEESPRPAASMGDLVPATPAPALPARQDAARSSLQAGPKSWLVQDKQGREFGPISRDELEHMAAARTLTCECRVRRQTSPVWLWAMEVFPELADDPMEEANHGENARHESPPSGALRSIADSEDDSAPEENDALIPDDYDEPYDEPHHGHHRRHRSRMLSHRGPAILMLGLMGFLCGLFGVAAAVMGIQDVRLMRSGDMDPMGYDVTMGGVVAGLLGTLVQCGVVAYLWVSQGG